MRPSLPAAIDALIAFLTQASGRHCNPTRRVLAVEDSHDGAPAERYDRLPAFVGYLG
jgi:hypothetical protein